MSTNDYGYRLLDAEELGETTEEETPGVTAEEGTEEKEEEVTV